MIYKKQNNCKGFSIIEILLCAALGLLLFEAVLQSYLNAKYLYQVQNDLAQINENIRFADFVLWQTIMQSGYAGCRKLSKLDLYELNGRCFGVRGYESSSVPDHLKNKHIVSSTDVVVITKASVANVPIADDVFAGAISFKIEGNLEVIDD
ncbi:MAG: hypothetical protein KKE11_01200, partial [Gammaproteobacteria bacterium]|nr:hypothetical protein [Gammaproteobacteria bacterium]